MEWGHNVSTNPLIGLYGETGSNRARRDGSRSIAERDVSCGHGQRPRRPDYSWWKHAPVPHPRTGRRSRQDRSLAVRPHARSHHVPSQSLTLNAVAALVLCAPLGLAAQSSADFNRAPGPSLVFAARAYDRANVLDSARADYEGAAVALPLVADWLWLRAAGVTADPAIRARDYASVVSPTARGRILWTEAQARERTGDFAGAARAYDSLGAHGDALRARAADTTDRAGLCVDLTRYIVDHHGTPDARAVTDVADAKCAPLSAEAELAAARSAAVAGPAARAVSGFSKVGTLTPADRYLYAMALARVHREKDAAREFARVRTPAAEYQRARVL